MDGRLGVRRMTKFDLHGGGKANDGFSQILPKTRMKKKMMMKTSSIL